jgi:hypothetical protein
VKGVELVLLKCVRCSMQVSAQDDEVAWVCTTCGQGLLLGDDGLLPLNVHWVAAGPQAGPRWQPVWVFNGSVVFGPRQTYGGTTSPDPLWKSARRFFVPAFPAPLNELESLGAHLTRQQPKLAAGPARGPLQNCTLLPTDARRVAEFVVLCIEAARKDKLRSLEFRLDLEEPELWVLPFS